jgi:uncharacterized protein (DUF2249 family)
MENPGPLRILDVRPTIARGGHPLEEVLAAAKALPKDGVLELIAPFEPRPLMKKLEAQGCAVRSTERDGAWSVLVAKRALPTLHDFSELEAPEPMERTLEAAVALAEGAVLLALVPRFPQPLIPELEAQGFEVAATLRPDGTALVWVRR